VRLPAIEKREKRTNFLRRPACCEPLGKSRVPTAVKSAGAGRNFTTLRGAEKHLLFAVLEAILVILVTATPWPAGGPTKERKVAESGVHGGRRATRMAAVMDGSGGCGGYARRTKEKEKTIR